MQIAGLAGWRGQRDTARGPPSAGRELDGNLGPLPAKSSRESLQS